MPRTPKAEKRKRDPTRPKKPTSAYFYYVAKCREDMTKKGQAITRVADFTKQVSAKWRNMTGPEKGPFEKLAAEDKKRFETEKAAWKGKSAKDENKPKRPQSAYFLFLADFRSQNKDRYAQNKDLLRGAGEAWKDLTQEQKQPYEKAAEGEKAKYEVAMREYNQSKAKQPRLADGAGASNAHEGASDEEEEDEEEEEEEDDE